MGIDEYCRGRAVAADNLHDLGVGQLRQPAAAKFDGCRDAEHTHAAQAIDIFLRDLGIPVNGHGVEMIVNILAHLCRHLLDLGALFGLYLGIRKKQRRSEMAKEQRFGKAQFFRSRKEQFLGLFALIG